MTGVIIICTPKPCGSVVIIRQHLLLNLVKTQEPFLCTSDGKKGKAIAVLTDLK